MKTTSNEWSVHGPYTLTNHKGEFDGYGWQINRPHPHGGSCALEYVMDGNLVKFFKTEAGANSHCRTLNKHH